jgi:hypothetical protein
MGEACSTYEGEVHSRFWWGNMKDIDHLEDPGINWMKKLKWIFRKWNGAWIELIWLCIGICNGLL